MKNQDFTTKIVVDGSPEDVTNSITNLRGWWSEQIQGDTSKINEVFNYHYQEMHAAKIKLVELIPGKLVIYEIVENYFAFTKDKNEWKGTKLVFEIVQVHGKTEVKFTHKGLVPSYECFEVCSDAWSNYIEGSLYNLITTGTGEPNPAEGGFNAALIEKFSLTEK